MHIKLLCESDVFELVEFYVRNEEHLRKWSPARSLDFYDVDAWKLRLKDREEEMKAGQARYFCGVDHSGRIIALCSLTNIVYGAFMACYMGYAIDAEYEGRGLMKKLCFYAIQYAFQSLKLHRIMANYMPSNIRSASLVKRLGFCIEGEATQYLRINGKWEDHVLTSITNQKKM